MAPQVWIKRGRAFSWYHSAEPAHGREAFSPMENPLRSLPGVDRVAAHPLLASETNARLWVEAARLALENARTRIRSGESGAHLDEIAARAAEILQQLTTPSLRPVINATGVILHTNLGRAPLSDAALAAIQAVGAGYSNLEYDLESGSRGSRFSHLEALLERVTGAE